MTEHCTHPHETVVITGGAGFVGQNLIDLLATRSDLQLVAIDRHRSNLALLRSRHPQVRTVLADLADPGPWQESLAEAAVVVQLHAEIVGTSLAPFERSNVHATELVLRSMKESSVPYLLHVSSSAVGSRARDHYAATKLRQEQLVRGSGLRHCVLRPTLMYGSFDPKHLGWLARFMRKTPVFPIPGHGRYLRQPLYVTDLCRVIERCVATRPQNRVFDIAGPQRLEYIEIIRTMKRLSGSRAIIAPIPVGLFRSMLQMAAICVHRPRFTVHQLESLTVGDDFPSVDVLDVFRVQPTAFEDGMRETLSRSESEWWVRGREPLHVEVACVADDSFRATVGKGSSGWWHTDPLTGGCTRAVKDES